MFPKKNGVYKPINKALAMALLNQNKFKFGCVVTNRRGKIISEAMNHMGKSHPFQAKYAKRVGREGKIWLHAEIMALINCRENPEEIWVARVWKDGTTSLAKPCPICTLAIKESGIKRIHYTNEFGKLTTVEV